jgi:hypothetical protein
VIVPEGWCQSAYYHYYYYYCCCYNNNTSALYRTGAVNGTYVVCARALPRVLTDSGNVPMTYDAGLAHLCNEDSYNAQPRNEMAHSTRGSSG